METRKKQNAAMIIFLVKDGAGIIVFHEIVSTISPGVQTRWQEVKALQEESVYYEFTGQYENVLKRTGNTFFGIGVAIKKKYLQEKAISLAE